MSRIKTSAEALTSRMCSGSGSLAADVRLTVKLSGFCSSVLSVTTNMLEQTLRDSGSDPPRKVIACCLMEFGSISLLSPLTVLGGGREEREREREREKDQTLGHVASKHL